VLSFRQHLARIGIAADEAVSYREFASRPNSLRAAMRSMNAPSSSDWEQVSDIYRDDFWTDEIQGVAWTGSHWIFCANARQAKPDSEDKALYAFAGGGDLGDGEWSSRIKFKDVPHPLSGMTESDDHWGQLTYNEGSVYVAHFWEEGPKKNFASAVAFKSVGGSLEFERWIELEQPPSPDNGEPQRVEFQGINPWDGLLYTYGAGHFFMHDPGNGDFTGKMLKLKVPVERIQGACFSPNGHLYIVSNATLPGDERFQTIWYYSALNGHRFDVIPVLADGMMPYHELEGVCFADVSVAGGRRAQIHTVLLENPDVSLDNIYFKAFSSSKPDIV
jgi:hypothetical protein